MFVVDTNVLLYAANTTYPESDRCRELLNEWRSASLPWFATWPIFYEFLRVATHVKVWEKPWSLDQGWRFIEAILDSPGFDLLVQTERHSAIVKASLNELPNLHGNIVHDFHTAVLMREHGIRRIYTRDNNFRRFPFVETVDPLDEVS